MAQYTGKQGKVTFGTTDYETTDWNYNPSVELIDVTNQKDIQTWVAGDYTVGQIVTYSVDSNTYICHTNTTTEQVPTDTTYWKIWEGSIELISSGLESATGSITMFRNDDTGHIRPTIGDSVVIELHDKHCALYASGFITSAVKTVAVKDAVAHSFDYQITGEPVLLYAPTGLSGSWADNLQQITLSWTQRPGYESGELQEVWYKLSYGAWKTYKDDLAYNDATLSNAAITTVIEEALTPATSYDIQFAIRVNRSGDLSPYSNIITLTITIEA